MIKRDSSINNRPICCFSTYLISQTNYVAWKSLLGWAFTKVSQNYFIYLASLRVTHSNNSEIWKALFRHSFKTWRRSGAKRTTALLIGRVHVMGIWQCMHPRHTHQVLVFLRLFSWKFCYISFVKNQMWLELHRMQLITNGFALNYKSRIYNREMKVFVSEKNVVLHQLGVKQSNDLKEKIFVKDLRFWDVLFEVSSVGTLTKE